jgi:hypothetical protein
MLPIGTRHLGLLAWYGDKAREMSRRVTGKSKRAGKQIDRFGFVNAFNGA